MEGVSRRPTISKSSDGKRAAAMTWTSLCTSRARCSSCTAAVLLDAGLPDGPWPLERLPRRSLKLAPLSLPCAGARSDGAAVGRGGDAMVGGRTGRRGGARAPDTPVALHERPRWPLALCGCLFYGERRCGEALC